MPAPVFFDGTGTSLRNHSPTQRVNDNVLPLTVVRTDGSTPFTGPQAGVDPPTDTAAALVTQLLARRFVNTVGPWWGPVVSAAVSNPVALTPSTDQRWLVASPGAGDWAGQAGNLAIWTGAAWLFRGPVKGTSVYDQNVGVALVYSGTAWGPAVLHEGLTDLQGGTVGQHVHLTSAQATMLTGPQGARRFLATPGVIGAPTMRAMELADIPSGPGGYALVGVTGAGPTYAALTAALVGAVPVTRTITAGSGLSGGGALSSNVTMAWDGVGVALNGVDAGTFSTVNIIGEAKITDKLDGSADVELPDTTLYALIFGR